MTAFATWLAEHHGEADTPVGDLARELHHDPQFPRSGGREDLRWFLEEYRGADSWVLTVFDVAWAMYEPDCSRSGCISTPASGTSLCAKHALADLL